VSFMYKIEGVEMKQALKLLLLISITALMTACKLAVIVVEGGEVQSAGSGTCVAGTICIVDVNDPNFSESFIAIPDSGWYFQKWNSGDGFFCGGAINPTCTLSFEGNEAKKWVEDMVASSEVFYLMPVFQPIPEIITVDGKDWYQPYLFLAKNWNDLRNEINAVCPAGKCNGLLNGHDMTGWTWATADDLNALFNHYLGSDEMGPGPDRYSPSTALDPWPADFFDDGWHPTREEWFPSVYKPTVRSVHGITRDQNRACLQESWWSFYMNTKGQSDCDLAGAWFYRIP
jgi:hypothetical protein